MINVAIYAGRSQSSRSSVKSRVASKLFCLKSSVRCRIRLRSADARLGRPWRELGGMADQAALGHRAAATCAAARTTESIAATVARAGFTQLRAAFANRLCESLDYRPARALISALSQTSGVASDAVVLKRWARLKVVCAS